MKIPVAFEDEPARRRDVPTIAKVDVFPLEYALAPQDQYGSSKVRATRRTATLVRLTTDDGAIGWGESYGEPEPTAALLRMLAPNILGRHLDTITGFLMNESSANSHTLLGSTQRAVVSGLDIAAWDAWARTLGVPISSLLGGRSRDSVQAYASTGYSRPGNDLDVFRQEIRDAVAAGFNACKIRVGFGPALDESRVAYARQELGTSRALMVDYNGSYTSELAVRSLEQLAPYDLSWAEEPLPPSDTTGWDRIRRRTSTALAAGEAASTRTEFKNLLCSGNIDIIQPDLTVCGGISEASIVGHMAAAWNIRISPHVWGGAIGLAASLQLMASLAVPAAGNGDTSPLQLELDQGINPLRDEMLTVPLVQIEGRVVIPNGPGLGVVPDDSMLKEFALKETSN